MLHLLDSRPDLQSALVEILGVPFDEMSKQDKLAAVRGFINGAMAFAPVRVGAKILREITLEANIAKGNTEELSAENEALIDRNAQLINQIAKLKRKLKKIKKKLDVTIPPDQLGHP